MTFSINVAVKQVASDLFDYSLLACHEDLVGKIL
jgi:hypothetical protein